MSAIRFLRHDPDAERIDVINAELTREALGDDLFDRLVDQVAEYRSYAVAFRGYVFEAHRN